MEAMKHDLELFREKAKSTSLSDELIDRLLRLRSELRRLREELHEEFSGDPEKVRRLDRNIHFLNRDLFSEGGPGPGLVRRAEEIPSKEIHYRRNQAMPVSSLPQSPEMAVKQGWDDSVGAACHQFKCRDKTNVKYVSPDGHSEVIFDKEGNIVTASEDYGTYNFVDSRKDPAGHFYEDVLPWLLWGNDETDSTDMHQRLKSLVVYGGIETLEAHAEESVRQIHEMEEKAMSENHVFKVGNMTIESSMSEETEEKIKNDLRNAAKDAAVHTVKKAKATAESAKAALEDVKKAVEDAKPEIDKAKDEAVSFIHEVIEEVKKDEQ